MDYNYSHELHSNHTWHPCSQMKDHELCKPLVIKRAYDCYLQLTDGRKLIDATASWWCKTLGHNHPILKQALLEQLEKFEHVMLANTTNETIDKLSYCLSQLMPGLDKVFYASDGCCAVEIAMKMSLQSRKIMGQQQRQDFLALNNAYHGETLAALSVCNLKKHTQAYSASLLQTEFIDVPYVENIHDKIWHDASEYWHRLEPVLEKFATTTTALIIEPILQAAGGMKIYSKDFLSLLVGWAKQYNIHIIADEIMTGVGRTGKMLACEHAQITADFICLGKGLTSGYLPLSAVITHSDIYDIFYDDSIDKAFIHSHTFSGNALAASVALATLQYVEQHNLVDRAQQLQTTMLQHMQDISEKTSLLENVRGIGAMVAADCKTLVSKPQLAQNICKQAIEYGAFMRPIANTLYWCPPLNISTNTLNELKDITYNAFSHMLA